MINLPSCRCGKYREDVGYVNAPLAVRRSLIAGWVATDPRLVLALASTGSGPYARFVPHYKPYVQGMLQDALMADDLGHQYGIPELHRAAEQIWGRAFDLIEQTHGAAERERAMCRVGYRTAVQLEATGKLRGGSESIVELIHRCDQHALDALRLILDGQDQEPSCDEGSDLDDRGPSPSP
jgi:hypothetical protein